MAAQSAMALRRLLKVPLDEHDGLRPRVLRARGEDRLGDGGGVGHGIGPAHARGVLGREDREPERGPGGLLVAGLAEHRRALLGLLLRRGLVVRPASAAAAAATAKGAQQAAGVAPTAPKAPEATAGRPSTEAKAVEEPATITPATEAKAAAPPPAPAAASEQAKGRSVGGDFVFGLRAGLIVPTQQILENLSSGTSTGPLVNLEGYYVLREWVRLGLMFEWQRYKINARDAEVGTLTTFSMLPVVELRPTRDLMRNTVGFEWVIPYASLGAGLNVHSFSNGAQLGNDSVSFANTFAFRVAGGFDFPITSNLAVNTEMAWKRDSGNFERNGLNGDFNASSLMFLFGLRVHF